nr:hemagglutinin repeat-containing protein [Cronobacter malonaticus]
MALGNLTLKLTNAFTNKNALAAGKMLTVTSNGAIDNRGVMQGQAVNVSAGGALTNNGQITTGNGASTLGGSSVALNDAGTLQGGGDVAIASRGNITVDGFTGTRGSLTLTAPGSIINTALLYAASNLALYANSITNQRGDILAGNSLWMQKDAAGNANAEVVNTSGNIETQNGDITIKTGHLLNTWDKIIIGEIKSEDLKVNYPSFAWDAPGTINLSADYFKPEEIYYSNVSKPIDLGLGGDPKPYSFLSLVNPVTTKEIPVSRLTSSTVASGSAGRLTAGRDFIGIADKLDNLGSYLLSKRDIYISGESINNQTYLSGAQVVYRVYSSDITLFPGYVDYSYPQIDLDEKYKDGVSKSSKPLYNMPISFGYISLTPTNEYHTEGSESLRGVLQGNGVVNLKYKEVINNNDSTDVRGKITLNLTSPHINDFNKFISPIFTKNESLSELSGQIVNSPVWKDQLQGALQQINGGGALENSAGGGALANLSATKAGKANLGNTSGLASAGVTAASVANITGGALANTQSKPVDTSAYPLPSGNNGFFVVSDNPKSPYLINVNPKLDGLGELDPALFGDLNKLLGVQPGAAPRETRTSFTNEKQFLGSSYMLGRLNLNPEYDYRFLGDAAFDTRYVSNALLNQTGNRYLNGVGSDLQQMQYLMDSAAAQQKSLGLQFGVALTRDQIASLDKSILWWESATVNGETVMIPKLYLSPKDVTVNNGSVIAGNNVSLKGGDITNSGSTLLARQNVTLDSQNSISNLNHGLINAGGELNLSAVKDIKNIGSAISGKSVVLESITGTISNITNVHVIKTGSFDWQSSDFNTELNENGYIGAQNKLSLNAGQNINIRSAHLKAGDDILINVRDNFSVAGNKLSSTYTNIFEVISRNNSFSTSTISAGGNLGIKAGDNLSVAASDIKAGGNAALAAGGDLNLDALQTSKNSRNGKRETHSTGLDRTTVSAGDNLTLSAGRDINAHAAALAAEKNIGVQAGRDVNLEAEATTSGDSYRSKKKTTINESVRQQGTELASGGNTVIIAGRDMNADAAQATAKGDIGVTAGRDINLATATESDYHYKEETKTKKGFLKKTTTHTVSEQSATREAGTLLSGDNVTLKAGEDLLVKGSAVAGDGNVALSAGKNVEIAAATNTDSNWQLKEKKKSGLMGSGGIGFTIGSSKTRHELKEKGTTQSQSVSTVGSTGGNVSITAGEQARVSGADLVAGKNLTLTGDSVVIEPGHDKRTTDQKFEQKSSGLTVALTGAVVDAVNNAVTAAKDATKQSDSRLAALQATKSVLSGYQAVQGKEMADTTGEPNAGIRVSVSLTTQKSKSEQHQVSDQVTGSTLNAGNDLSINATGKNHGANSGDIVVAGSSMKAGGDASLNAARDILLTGAANTQKTTGSNSSSGGGVGVSVGVGQGSAGLSVFANVNAAKGKEKGDGTDWTETTLDSGGKVSLHSGQDASLTGAQVNGNQVTADIGRNLTITSLQDSNHYDSKQSSVSAGGSFTFGTMTGSGYVNFSQDKMHSTFNSVAEQSGIFAGKGGFDVTVGSHTQLNGGAIGSTATADKNSLDTGTLGYSNLTNKADYKVSHSGGGFSSSGSFGAQAALSAASTLMSGMSGSGHAQGTTQAAVSEGTLTIRDKANSQDTGGLQRDVTQANDAISPIFNKEKEQNRLQAVQMVSDIGNQVADIVRTQSDLDGLKAAIAKTGTSLQGLPEKERLAKLAALRDTAVYKKVTENTGTGSDVQRAITAATAAVSGLAGGNLNAALAGAAAPYIANEIGKNITDQNTTAGIMAHAVVNAVLAKVQGQDALAGASGAVVGEAMGILIAKEVYKKAPSQLNDTEKQTVAALSTLASGLAGALAGNSTEATATAAKAGQTTVENNLLRGGTDDGQVKAAQEHAKNIMSCADDPGSEPCRQGKALQNAMIVALPAGLGGGMLIAATSELAAAAQVAIRACAGNVVLCLNNAGIMTSEAIVPGGVGAGGAIGIGKTTLEATTVKAEAVAANAAKNNPSWKAGEYLEDFKPSSTPLELIREQAGKGSQTAYIRMDHILNGEVKTLKDGTKVGSGGHYIRDPNIKIDKVTGAPDSTGVSKGYISVRDSASGQWVNKKAETTFFPEQWSKRQTAQEIESAFKHSERIPNTEMWSGKSSSGVKIQGYYGKPDGTGATAWPVYTGRNK